MAIIQRGGEMTSSVRTYVESRSSPNGGTVNCRMLSDHNGTFIQVATYGAPAYEGLRDAVNSVQQLNVNLDQDVGDNYSSAWGDYEPTEVRVIGCTDWHFISENRKVDWIYGVPADRKWKHFFSDGNSSGMTLGSGVDNKYGFSVTYAKDSAGGWVNNSMTRMGMSDGNPTVSAAGFTTPTSSFINLNTNQDAKLYFAVTGTFAAQDQVYAGGFGYDDSNAVTANSGRNQYSNASSGNALGTFSGWVLIKVNTADL